jgi:hypothetical protein
MAYGLRHIKETCSVKGSYYGNTNRDSHVVKIYDLE